MLGRFKQGIRGIRSNILDGARPEVCDDLALHAGKAGWDCREIHPPIADEIAGLVEGEQRAEEEFAYHRNYFDRPQSLVRIPWARVRDEIGLVFLPGGKVCYEGNWWYPYLLESPAYTSRFRRKRTIEGHVFTLLSLWSATYYHWFHDVLPRLLNSLPYLPASTRFLVQNRLADYQLESLEALGIGRDRLIKQVNIGDSVVENLWFATPLGHSTFGGGSALQRVGQTLVGALVAPAVEEVSPFLYASRRQAKTRRVTNEAELEVILRDHGFRSVVLEEMPFREQVSLCNRVRILVGPHGAGLTNSLFMNKGGLVGEIAGPSVVPCYSVMSRQLGHEFHRLTARQPGQDADFNVCADLFRSLLRTLRNRASN